MGHLALGGVRAGANDDTASSAVTWADWTSTAAATNGFTATSAVTWANWTSAAAGAADPMTAGLILDLAADFGVTQSGNAISAWLDQSSNARSFAQATTANKPTYVTNAYGTTVAGGTPTLPAVRGNSDRARYLQSTAGSDPSTATLIAVFTKTALGSTYVLDNSASRQAVIENFSGTSKVEWYDDGGVNRFTFTTSPSSGLNQYAVTMTGVAGTYTGYLNNSQVFSGTETLGPLKIQGVLGLAGSAGTDGDLVQLRMFSSVLSAGDLTAQYNYLKQKWGTN